ncbi:hypothetical protein LG634_09385 [Streptomyces bambusae]|uniref:hypothetical protein n=1 Tax=Streptomyces bambusae TaxID=1550616 RepID=UPI001CFD614C|nr:hypothetical protein [Streptomyces bambusae]MCB5165039.1 hypothetical protein [Streptomyces bambusae]
MSTARRRTPGPVVTLAVALLAAVVLAVDGSGLRPAGLTPPHADGPAVPARGADPSAFTLPLQAYRPTPEQARTIARAETTLVGRCLAGFGIVWKPLPALPADGPRTELDRRYGIHDRDLAARYGYQVDPLQQARYDAAVRAAEQRPRLSADARVALSGTGSPPGLPAEAGPEARRGRVNGRKVPAGGCTGEARRALGSPTQGVSPLVQRLANSSYPQSLDAPSVRAVFARWSACMRTKGFTYGVPMAADDDPRFRPRPGGPSATEIRTALADLDCRVTHQVAETWHAAEAAIQRESVARHAKELAADRRALDAVVRKAGEVLAGA